MAIDNGLLELGSLIRITIRSPERIAHYAVVDIYSAGREPEWIRSQFASDPSDLVRMYNRATTEHCAILELIFSDEPWISTIVVNASLSRFDESFDKDFWHVERL